MKNNAGQTIERFKLGSRLGHWSHAITFVFLLLTGAVFVFKGYGNLFGTSTLKLFSDIHHFMAWPFTFLTIFILFVGARKDALKWIKDCFTWRKNDFKFIAGFPKEFFGLKSDLPKQGKFNAGEKINSLLTIFGSLVMVITGWILYFPNALPDKFFIYALPIHSTFAIILGAVMIAHAYLGLLHPNSKESIRGMIDGHVSMEFAEGHHALWVEEKQQEKEANQMSEIKSNNLTNAH